MKKLILVLASIALIIGAGLITLAIVYKYENIKTEKALQEEQRKADMNSTVAKAKWEVEDKLNTLKTEYNTLHAECVKGAAAYPLLTTANKAKVEVASCGEPK